MTSPAGVIAHRASHLWSGWRVRRLNGRATLMRYCLDCPAEQAKRAPHHDAPRNEPTRRRAA